MKLHLFALLLCCCELLNLATISTAWSAHPIVVVIAFDGFSQHLMQKEVAPSALHDHIKSAATAEWMLYQWPPETLPNLHSVATGLYPVTHGVLGDRTFNGRFQCIGYGQEMYAHKTNVTPIWTLNELNGDGRHSGVIAWPGAEFSYRNHSGPTFARNVTECLEWDTRIDLAVQWLNNAITPANLVLLYFEAGENRTAYVSKAYTVLEYYYKKLDELTMREKVNTIVLGAHQSPHGPVDGMPRCDPQLPAASSNESAVNKTNASVENSNCTELIFKNLLSASAQLNTFKTEQYAQIKINYEKNEISQDAEKFLDKQKNNVFAHPDDYLGMLGPSENTSETAHPLFMADGPKFQPDAVVPPFENIDIYALLSNVLNLTGQATPINGTFDTIRMALRTDANEADSGPSVIKIILFLILAALLIACGWYIFQARRRDGTRML